MDFPIADLMDQGACYDKLVGWLHPDGLACPRCGARDRPAIHRRHRDPVLDYRCAVCGRVAGAPLRGLSVRAASNPSAANRLRVRSTVQRLAPVPAAPCSSVPPSSAAKRIWKCRRCRPLSGSRSSRSVSSVRCSGSVGRRPRYA